jgi:hypothetical protein
MTVDPNKGQGPREDDTMTLLVGHMDDRGFPLPHLSAWMGPPNAFAKSS